MRSQRNQVSVEDQAQAADGLLRVLQSAPFLSSVQHLMGTLPRGPEISARPVCEWWLESGRKLYLPKVDDDEIHMSVHQVPALEHCLVGYRDCPEPDLDHCPRADLSTIDVILLPGLAFDRKGNRIGHGKGHYDRMVANRRKGTVLVGIAYGFQLVTEVPRERGLDQPVDWVATPGGLIECL